MDKLMLRRATQEDAAKFLSLWDTLDLETEFMLYEPGERKATLEQQTSQLAASEKSQNVAIYVIEDTARSELVGFTAGRRNANLRDLYTLNIVIGLRQIYTGKKLGARLLTELEGWAKSMDIKRLELTVMTENEFAVSLYERLGYEIEGTKRMSVHLSSGFKDEYVMSKLL
jgi:RimJ/RimL family protein N-acetyltransferase